MPLAPLERAQLCVFECQYFYPEYWRSTMTADAYRRCLDSCSGLPATAGLPEANWPADLVREVGHDVAPIGEAVGGALRSVQQAIQTDLLLLALIAGAVYLTVRRLAP